MPTKKSKHTVTHMEAKIDALETELAEMRTSLAAVTSAVKDLPSSFAAMMERSLGKSVQQEDASVTHHPGAQSGVKTPAPNQEKVGL